MENLEIAKKLTDIAQNIQTLITLTALVSISERDEDKIYFMNEVLTPVLDRLSNAVGELTNLSDELVELD